MKAASSEQDRKTNNHSPEFVICSCCSYSSYCFPNKQQAKNTLLVIVITFVFLENAVLLLHFLLPSINVNEIVSRNSTTNLIINDIETSSTASQQQKQQPNNNPQDDNNPNFSSSSSSIATSLALPTTSTTGNPQSTKETKYYNDNIEYSQFYNVTETSKFNIWNDPKIMSTELPKWMIQYFDWHHIHATQFRQQQQQQNTSYKLLVMSCLQNVDAKCGGTADRIKSFLWALQTAHRSKRLLFIYWSKPTALEEFLVPPEGGIDWRLPKWYQQEFHNQTSMSLDHSYASSLDGIWKMSMTDMPLVRTRTQSHNGGSEMYNQHLLDDNEPTYEQIYSKVWTIFFRPSIRIEQIIAGELGRMHVSTGTYVAAHLRALYGVTNRPEPQLREWAINAVNCATTIRPGYPIYFASDSPKCKLYAKAYAQEKQIALFFRNSKPNPPLHLDKNIGSSSSSSSSIGSSSIGGSGNNGPHLYYDTFVDLYTMALSGCVTYGVGGYGHWALLIGGNVTCGLRQYDKKESSMQTYCQFHKGPNNVSNGQQQLQIQMQQQQQQQQQQATIQQRRNGRLFLPPMQ